jgi:tetratricopeptide (TPR) repeat protein
MRVPPFVWAVASILAASSQAQDIRDPIDPPAQCHSILVGSHLELVDAEAQRTQFEALGFSPVTIVEEEIWNRVLGEFELYVDARLHSDDLRARGLTEDGRIRTLANEDGEPLEKTTGPLTPLFHLEVSKAQELPVASLAGNPIYAELERIDSEEGDEAYRAALLEELPKHDAADPIAGYIHVNLGILDIIDRDYTSAMAHCRAVADGEIASAASHRVMAMIRVAWLTHWDKVDRLGAYQAYREIQQFTGSDTVRARCQVECVGLLMELAESAKGTHEEMRREARRAFATITPSSKALIQHCSTLELMYSETFSRQPEPDYATAARLGEELIDRYSAYGEDRPVREIAAALHQTGRNHKRLGDNDQAIASYNRLFSEVPLDLDHFAGINPHAEAMYGLASIAAREGGEEGLNQMLRDIMALYPDQEVSAHIRRKFPNLESSTQPSWQQGEE